VSRVRKKWSAADANRVGAIRPSQIMFTYGVGSMIDLPAFTAVVAGLETWTHEREEITERRVLAAVQGVLGPTVKSLETPPRLDEVGGPLGDWTRAGISVYPFPRWLRCSNPKCSLLAPIDLGLFTFEGDFFAPHEARFVHMGCAGGNSKRTALPVRFVLACPNGHLDDLHWVDFSHPDRPCTGDPVLELRDTGLAARATDQRVSCRTCGQSQGLTAAFGAGAPTSLPMCRGRHPHLTLFEECDQRALAMLVGATNSWFPLTTGAISIPDLLAPLELAISHLWSILEKVDSVDDLQAARKFNPNVDQALAPFSTDAVMQAIVHRRVAPIPDADPDLLGPEWKMFAGPPVDIDELRTHPVGIPSGHAGRFDSTVIADRIRKVTALYGFTRVDSAEDDDDTELVIRRASLTRGTTTWVPAAESRGEGLLLRLDESAVAAWESAVAGHQRIDQLRDAVVAWRARRGLVPNLGLPSSRFVLLHSLSHALIHQVALECGYTTASLGERVYSRTPSEGDPMAGVLIYTSASDSEGTLGGLVALGDDVVLGRIVTEALQRAALCSSDPFCSEQEPDDDQGNALHGAACHTCLFLPETTCAHANRSLDRSVLIPTFSLTDLAYFPVS